MKIYVAPQKQTHAKHCFARVTKAMRLKTSCKRLTKLTKLCKAFGSIAFCIEVIPRFYRASKGLQRLHHYTFLFGLFELF